MANADDAGIPAVGTGTGIDSVAASILQKLGGTAPRNERGQFAPADSEADGSPEAEEASPQAETEEGAEPETEEATEESEETEQEDTEQPQLFTVKVDGKDVQVTHDELLKGYSRESDYTRKTQALSEERKAWESKRDAELATERQTLAGEREQAKAVLNAWTGWIETQLGNKEYWDKLRAENPGEWSAKQYELSQQLQALQTQQAEISKKETEKRNAEIKKLRMAEYNQLVTLEPDWRDAKKLQAAFGKMGEYAVQVRGFEPEELGTVIDHRMWLVLNDAAQFHALKEKKPIIEPKLKAVQSAKPGAAPQASSPSTKVSKTFQRLQKTGRTEDLAEHLKAKFKLG